MTDLQLYTALTSLPQELKNEVERFIVTLKTKKGAQAPLKQRQFGAAKGFFEMQPDFDEPLEDFKDYMQ